SAAAGVLPFRFRHPSPRTAEHANDRPATNHAEQVRGPEDQGHARRQAAVKVAQGELVLVLQCEDDDRPRSCNQNQKTDDSHDLTAKGAWVNGSEGTHKYGFVKKQMMCPICGKSRLLPVTGGCEPARRGGARRAVPVRRATRVPPLQFAAVERGRRSRR